MFLKADGTNFSLNDEEFNNIKKISKDISNETLLLFWQFTIKTLEEIDIVSNQNLSIEMFLIRLIYLKEISNISNLISESENITEVIKNQTIEKNLPNNQNLDNDLLDAKNKTIGQIKNVEQEKKQTQQPILKTQHKTILQIKSIICTW